MKSIQTFFLGILFLTFPAILLSQDVLLLTENFETGGESFTLNGAELSANTGNNQWIVNNSYTGNVNYPNTTSQNSTNGGTISFAPQSNYLHIHDQPSGVLNNNYDPSSASDRFAYTTFGICTYAMEEVHLSFFYLSEGSPTAYGNIYYSLDGGPWIQFGLALYNNTSLWQYVDITDPIFSDVGSLRFGFRWQNDAGAPPYSQSFSIDDVTVVGNYSQTSPVDINVLSVSPNPVCQGSFVTLEYQLSDTLCDGNYEIELSNSSGNFTGAFGSWVMSINYPTTSGFVTVELPDNAAVGDCYKFRISRTAPPPEITGIASGCFEIIECPNEITTLQPVVTLDTNAVCIGSVIDIPFWSTGIFNPNNQYICQLSEVDGTFSNNPPVVGSSPDPQSYNPAETPFPGNVSGLIPVTEPGCNYFIRVISTNPDAIGTTWGPFCISECDITTNNNEDLFFCVSSCNVDPDGENELIDIDINTWDGLANYGPGNVFNTQLLSSMDFSQIGSDGILGSVAATTSTQLNVHIPCADSLADYGIPVGMNYMRVVATESSTPENDLGSLIRVTIGVYNETPLTITAASFPDNIPVNSFCVGETGVFSFQPYDPSLGSTYMWQSPSIFNGTPFESPSGATSNLLYINFNGQSNFTLQVQETNNGCVGPWSEPFTIPAMGDPNVNIIGPSTVCLQDTVNFEVNFYPDTYYSWSTDAPGTSILYQDTANSVLNIALSETGTYTFEIDVLNECGSGDDDITINVIDNPEAVASPDTSMVCIGGSTQLSAQTGANYSFQWFEGATEIGTTSTISVSPTDPMEYYLEVTGTGNCVDLDTVFVDVLYPDAPTQLYDSLCPGGLIEIDLIAPIAGLYAWQDGSNSPVLVVNDVGTYELTVSPIDSICPELYEFVIEPMVPDSAILLIDSVCPGGQGLNPITLVSPLVGEYYWSTQSNLPQINVNDTGIYVLQVVMPDSLCPLTYQWLVSPDTCYAPPDLFFYVPNSFSPNGDDINDVFGPVFSDPSLVIKYKMTIFDRWGEIVFQSEDVHKKWMGDFRTGEYFVNDGSYTWLVEYEQMFVADRIKEYGHVVMLR